MTRMYVSEGRIEEIEITTGGLLPGDYRVEHRLFNLKGEQEDRDCINVFKGDTRLASIFFNESVGEVCVHHFAPKLSLRKETICLIFNLMNNWNAAMKDLPVNHAAVLYDPEKTAK